MRGRLVVIATAISAVLAAAGCAGSAGTGGEPDAAAPAPTSTAPAAEGGPLTDLPECSAPPGPTGVQDAAADLVLPDGAVVTDVEDLGELVSVRGFVAATPIQVREFYEAEPGIELYVSEDELYEAEVLYGAGDARVFVKAQATCQQGSALSIFIGPEDGEGLPPVAGS